MHKRTLISILLISLLFTPLFADQGASDSYGYMWSNTTGGTINYNWVDLQSETSVFGSVFNDSLTGAISLPFSFTFYGTSYNQVYISSNGWLSFISPGDSAYQINTEIPAGGGPDAMLAVYWDSLNSTAGNPGGVYYRYDGTAPYRTFTVQWRIIDGSDEINFEVILYERLNLIKYQYNTVAAAYAGGDSATIGIKANSSQGNQYSFNQAGSVSSGFAILFHNARINDVSASILPTTAENGGFEVFTYTVSNIDASGAVGLGKADRLAIGNPFSTVPTVTSVSTDGVSKPVLNSTSKPTDPSVVTWYYQTFAGTDDSLFIQTSQFDVKNSMVVTFYQGIPDTQAASYTYGASIRADLSLTAQTPLSNPTITISGGTLQSIVIRDAPGGAGSPVGSRSISTDDSLVLYAAGYDAGLNYIGDQAVTWALTGNLDGSGGFGTSFTFRPSVSPTTGTITATISGIDDATGTINVGPGSLAALQIRTGQNNTGQVMGTLSMTTDDSQTFWAAGLDGEGNYIADQVVNWTSTLGISANGQESITFNPTAPVSGTLTATTTDDLISYTTGTIQVSLGGLHHLIIRNAANGLGGIVTDVEFSANNSITLWAAGYTSDGNFIADQNVTWTVTGNLDGPVDTGTSYTFNPVLAPRSGTIVATFGGTISDATGTISVIPGPIASLVIKDAANDLGDPVPTLNITTDDSRTLYAAGYDGEGNYRGDEGTAAWTSVNLGVSGNGGSFTYSPTAPVTGTLTATVGSANYVTNVTVSGGELDHIIIRDATGGIGGIVGDRTITTDDTLQLFAAGYDAEDNYIGDQAVNWSLTGTIDGDGSLLTTSYTFDPTEAPRSGSIIASIDNISDATGTITVNVGALARISINTTPDASGVPFGGATITADQSITLYSVGYDAEDNYISPFSGSWISTGTLDPVTPSGSAITFSPTNAPTDGIIQLTYLTFSDVTDSIHVVEGSLASIKIRNAANGAGEEFTTASITADDSITLYAAGYDDNENFLSDVSVSWFSTGTLDIITDVGASFTFRPVNAPSSGAIGAETGGISDFTGTINVGVGALNHITINASSGASGEEVGNQTLSAGQDLVLYASGYDSDNNYVQAISASWSSTGTLDNVSASGTSYTFTPVTAPSSGYLVATGSGFTDSTGVISVVEGALNRLRLRTQPNNGGVVLSDTSLTADSALTMYAAGYDINDNYLGDFAVDWFSTGTLDMISASGSSYTFNPVLAPASGTIGVTDGTFGTSTGTITVTVGSLASIRINSAFGSTAPEVLAVNLTAGQPLSLYAAGYDADGNYRSAISAIWSSTGTLDAVADTNTSIIFVPATAPSSGTIIATSGTRSDATGTITVEEGSLDHLVIRTATGGGGVAVTDTSITADMSLTMYAAAYDANNNYLQDVSVNWSSTGTLDNVIATGTSYTFNPVTAPSSGTIRVVSGGYNAETGTISITVGVLDHISVNSSSGAGGVAVGSVSLTADQSTTVYSAGYDADNNYISMVSAVWSSTGTLDPVTATATNYTFSPTTAPTNGTLRATFSGHTDDTGPITVSAGALHHLQINNIAGASGVEVGAVTLNVDQNLSLFAAGYDQHNNYRGLENAAWTSTGSLDDVNEVAQSIVFEPNTASTSGTIIADVGGISDTTGTINVQQGTLATIRIRNAPGGGGTVYGDVNMTADDSLFLYAAGYDGGDNYLGDISVTWSSSGTLDPISATGSSYIFRPVLAPRSGIIRATASGINALTGTITVTAGAAASITDYSGLGGQRTTVAGSTQWMRVRIVDQDGNPVSGTTVTFSPAERMSDVTDVSDGSGLAESVYTTPRDADFSYVYVTVPGLSPYIFTVYGIRYTTNSLLPKVAMRGENYTFQVSVSNPGNVDVPINTSATNISFTDGTSTFEATLQSPSTLPANNDSIPLTFVSTMIPETFVGGSYTPEIQIVGRDAYSSMNGVILTDPSELTIGSTAITMGNIQIVGLTGTNQVLQGDQGIVARMTVLNVGIPLTIDPFPETSILFRDNATGTLQPVNNLTRTDDLTVLASNVTSELTFTFDIPQNYSIGQIDVYGILSLDGGNLRVTPETPSGVFYTLSSGNADYVEGSLTPDVIIARETVYFRASFQNTGTSNIVLIPAESWIDVEGDGLPAASLSSQFTLNGNSTTEILFNALTMPVGITTGAHNVQWHLEGTLSNGGVFDTTATIVGDLQVVNPARLEFTNIAIVPDVVRQGQTDIVVNYTIRNQGQSDAVITNFDHRFRLEGGDILPSNQWLPTSTSHEFPLSLAAGQTGVYSVSYTLLSTATTGTVVPAPIVSYHDIRTASLTDTSQTILVNDEVDVIAPASVKITQLLSLAPNGLFVNVGQTFNMRLSVRNTGADLVQYVRVHIFRGAAQEPLRVLELSNIASGAVGTTTFSLSESTAGTINYTAYIDTALDAIGNAVRIDQPDDRNEAITYQEPSRFDITTKIYDNSIYSDSIVVAIEQVFKVRVLITNYGESPFAEGGDGSLALHIPHANFEFVGSDTDSVRIFTEQDTELEWELRSLIKSPTEDFQLITLSVVDMPIDQNTGQPVASLTIVDDRVHVLSEEKGIILDNQIAIISPAGAINGIVSTTQLFVVEADITFNSSMSPDNRTATISIPFEYQLPDGQSETVDLLSDSPVQWTVRAPNRDRNPEQISVMGRGFDANSGEPVEKNSNILPIQTVNRAELTQTLTMKKEAGTAGDTLSVGQNFSLEVLVSNIGTAAATGTGRMYIEGLADNPVISKQPAMTMDTLFFTIGETVTWDLTVNQYPTQKTELITKINQLLHDLRSQMSINTKNGMLIESSWKTTRDLYDQIEDLVIIAAALGEDLTVNLLDIPADENSNMAAFTQDSSKTITIFIQPKASISVAAFDAPDTVSTDQQFDVIVTGKLENNLIYPAATLQLPESFEAYNGPVLQKSLDSNHQARFTIKVPPTVDYYGAVEESLTVFLTGVDANTGEEVVPSTPAQTKFRIQLKPELYLARAITAPVSAQKTGILSHGQTLTVEVWPSLVATDKSLEYAAIDSNGIIELNENIFTSYNFEKIENETYKKSFDHIGQKLQFKLRSPQENRTALLNFQFDKLPLDDNSRTTVNVNADSGSVTIPVTVAEKEVTVVLIDTLVDNKVFTRGEGQHVLLAFNISNEGHLDNLYMNSISLRFISHVDTTSLSGEAVLDLVQKILVMNYDQAKQGLVIDQAKTYADFELDESDATNPLIVPFDEIGNYASNESETVVVVAEFKSSAVARSFRTVLTHINAYDDNPDTPVSIVDADGRSIVGNPNFTSEIFSVISEDPGEAFGNYPNPFGRPPNLTTKIRYNLQSTSDVRLMIFSLAGELVRSQWNRDLSGQGRGYYEIEWDGKNDKGYTVLNGVYLCAIEIKGESGTQRYMTKIAFIK